MTKRLRHNTARTAVVIGGLLMAAGIVGGLSRPGGLLIEDLYKIGLALVVGGATGWVLAKTSATEHQIECIRQQAYDEGYSDGCMVARVVELRRSSAGPVVPVVALAPDSPAQQLGDQCDVGQGA